MDVCARPDTRDDKCTVDCKRTRNRIAGVIPMLRNRRGQRRRPHVHTYFIAPENRPNKTGITLLSPFTALSRTRDERANAGSARPSPR